MKKNKLIKIIVLNILIIFSFLFLLFMSPPIIFGVYNIFKFASIKPVDPRKDLDLYANYPWAEDYFYEMNFITNKYYDFLTWRTGDFSSKTINIRNGQRKSLQSNENVSSKEFYFFGGSTTWGLGTNDDNTYPSIISTTLDIAVRNYGDIGYIARQSMAKLVNLVISGDIVESEDKSAVVFMDGVNEVVYRCRSDASDIGSPLEKSIRFQVESDYSIGVFSFKKTFAQLFTMFQKINSKIKKPDTQLGTDSLYDCHKDTDRAEYIARSLVKTWVEADRIAKQNGLLFLAVLQPVVYISNYHHEISYLDFSNNHDMVLAQQYQSVYPLILRYVSSTDLEFLDLSHAFNNCINCFIDFCHVGPQGNTILADNIGEKLMLMAVNKNF